MPSSRSSIGPSYTIFFEGTRTGTAFELLDWIRQHAGSKVIKEMTTEQYAKLLVTDAPYFLPKDLLQFLEKQSYASEFDRALRYLSEMPTSGVRILASSSVTI